MTSTSIEIISFVDSLITKESFVNFYNENKKINKRQGIFTEIGLSEIYYRKYYKSEIENHFSDANDLKLAELYSYDVLVSIVKEMRAQEHQKKMERKAKKEKSVLEKADNPEQFV